VFVVIWEFTVNPAFRDAFERAYGPDGDWARLFRPCTGYIATELLHDAEQPDRCLTLDYWRLPEQYVAAMTQVAKDYAAIDATCAEYTLSERRVGNFVAD